MNVGGEVAPPTGSRMASYRPNQFEPHQIWEESPRHSIAPPPIGERRVKLKRRKLSEPTGPGKYCAICNIQVYIYI